MDKCGPTHHNACDCREAYFADIVKQLAYIQRAVDFERKMVANEVVKVAGLRRQLAAVTAERDRLLAVRPEVRAFAVAMEEKLKANDHKGGWRDDPIEYFFNRLTEEMMELGNAICRDDGVRGEAVDVANFAMSSAPPIGSGWWSCSGNLTTVPAREFGKRSTSSSGKSRPPMNKPKPSGPLWATRSTKTDIFPDMVREHKIWGDDIPCRLIPGHGKVVPLELVNNLVGAVDDYIDADEGDDKRERNAELVAALRAAIEGAL